MEVSAVSFLNGDFEYRESQRLEFKEAVGGLPDDLWETYSAFANTEGGEIVLGVRENDSSGAFEAVGVPDAQTLADEFWDAVRNPQKVSRDVTMADGVQTICRDGRDFLVIDVPRAERDDKPVSVYDRRAKRFISYVRRGSGDRKASEADLRLMSYDSEPSADRRPLVRFGLDALCKETIARYRTAFANDKPRSPWNSDSPEDFLFHVGAVAKGHDGVLHPTEAGLLAFGHEYEITNFLPRYLLDYRLEMSGNGRWDDRVVSQSGDWSGNVFDFYQLVTQRLQSRLMAPFSTDEFGTGHGSRNPVTEAANEAVTNALVHAYYGNASSVTIVLSADGLEVANTGSFLIDRDVAIAGGFSEPRNPTLMRIFGFVGASDRAGSGLSQMWTSWKGAFGVEPVLEESHSPANVRLSLPLPRGLSALEGVHGGSAERRYEDVLAIVRENSGGVTASDVHRLSGRSERDSQRALKRLFDDGELSRSRVGRTWVYSVQR